VRTQAVSEPLGPNLDLEGKAKLSTVGEAVSSETAGLHCTTSRSDSNGALQLAVDDVQSCVVPQIPNIVLPLPQRG
jgi:hypothetical protein